ncbi:MAG TPA: crosslink repair DNA glycosylase YcaQ family protein, partial [Spirochaetia bacterium]|nr:crosslink repair DNA glycosylase YcaQ family protein [Spirochaetia bacterium]
MARRPSDPERDDAVRRGRPVTHRQVTSFRLRRQHLAERAPQGSSLTALGDMAGAQAQVVSAARISLWARVHALTPDEVDAAIFPARTIVRAACMRHTLHLVPSTEVAMFVRGATKRAERDVQWMLNKGAGEEELDRVLSAVLEVLDRPLSRTELVESAASLLGLPRTKSADGWWGNTRELPSIQVGPIACPANYLLSLASGRGIICYADYRGGEPTFVRADA